MPWPGDATRRLRSDAGVIRAGPRQYRLREGWRMSRRSACAIRTCASFRQRNPGHERGDELCCLAPLTRANFTPAAYRVIGPEPVALESVVNTACVAQYRLDAECSVEARGLRLGEPPRRPDAGTPAAPPALRQPPDMVRRPARLRAHRDLAALINNACRRRPTRTSTPLIERIAAGEAQRPDRGAASRCWNRRAARRRARS